MASAMEKDPIRRPPRPRIRTAQADDAAVLSLIGQATILETYATLLPLADMLAFCRDAHGEAAYAKYLADGALAWIAEDALTGAPLGYTLLTEPDLGGGDFTPAAGDIELKRIYLLGRCQGTGLAQSLMATVVEEAVAAGHTRLLLGVHRGNERALAFYSRQGLQIIGRRDFHIGDQTYDDPILARPLAPTGTAS